jgi:hypothetical protein
MHRLKARSRQNAMTHQISSAELKHEHRLGRHRLAPSLPRFAIPLLLLAAYAAIVLLHVNLLSPYFHAGIGVYFRPNGSKLVGTFLSDISMYRLYAERLLHLQTYLPSYLPPTQYTHPPIPCCLPWLSCSTRSTPSRR